MTGKDTLEMLVDKYGLNVVLEMLADVLGEKAEHVAVNWQDTVTAKLWDRTARQVQRLAETLDTD
jgi:hypothetical protein